MNFHPLPQVDLNSVMGLVKVVEDVGGREDVFRLARETNFEFGQILQVIKAAEMLGLVHTPGGDVEVTDLGRKVLKSKILKRKELIREQIRKLPIFVSVLQMLQRTEEGRADRDVFLEAFALFLPEEDPERLLDTVIDWGRFAELVGYNDDSEEVYLNP
jgi:NitT/TauT family transport system ATP-binding protein